MPSCYSDPFNGYNGNDRWRRSSRVEHNFAKYRKHAEKLLDVLDVWEQDLKYILADCNKWYEEAKYTHNINDALEKIIQLNDVLNDLDREMRECGLHVAPPKKFWKKRWY
ncbi:hypothetical protein E8E12_006528 [Didymella heteroderae]|uniref:Uncharacterized protein n=1 Tax=Didymella heteroderae TaxID=1769908 RepID=A0A9P4WU18_9PLEO|nr:hypothetical protein E8E12_006528 [Didymella heteroderae]